MSIRHRVHRVLYLPIDDRPCNVVHVQLLTRMVDYELLIPPTELLGHYTRPGDADKLAAWLKREMAGGSVDAAIISIDMLAYGGLVASRATDVRTQLALERLNLLAELRQLLPNGIIYAFNTIMRLSITATSDEAAVNWQLLREWAETLGRIDALGEPEDHKKLAELETKLPISLIGKFRACRERNHEVNCRVIEEVAKGNIDFLVLAQEDAAKYGPHVNEQKSLTQLIAHHNIAERTLIHPGADELGQTLFARFVHKHMEKVPRAYVTYANPDDATNIAEFEDRPFSSTLRGQMQAVGVELADNPASADFVLAINPPASGKRADYVEGKAAEERRTQARRFCDAIAKQMNTRRVAICDVAFPNGAEDCFVSELLNHSLQLRRLLAFSAWNTAANSVGSALAHASLRLIALQDKGAFDLANLLVDLSPMRYLQLLDTLIDSEKAHIELLFWHIADDWLYQTRVRPEVTEHVVKMLQASIFDLADSHERVEHLVSDRLIRAIADIWASHFLGRESVYIGPQDNVSSLAIAELEETRVTLPWGRLFEISLSLKFGIELVAEQ